MSHEYNQPEPIKRALPINDRETCISHDALLVKLDDLVETVSANSVALANNSRETQAMNLAVSNLYTTLNERCPRHDELRKEDRKEINSLKAEIFGEDGHDGIWNALAVVKEQATAAKGFAIAIALLLAAAVIGMMFKSSDVNAQETVTVEATDDEVA